MLGYLLPVLLLASLVAGDICPDGYTQAPNGGNCFYARTYWNWYLNRFDPVSNDYVDQTCNNNGGGMVASIHSEDENSFAGHLSYGERVSTTGYRNIGLRCVGKTCKWDDGSPVDYTNFAGDGPIDGDKMQCYGMQFIDMDYKWTPKSCDSYPNYSYYDDGDIWTCSVKAKTFECAEGETEYKGGCVSVHTTPLDWRSADASCPGGGHLASVHGSNENQLYTKLALSAGVNGTFYIGGQYSNGKFEWVDGSYYDCAFWANSFPNTIFGTCVQMLLSSDIGSQGQWTNIDCSIKQPYICFRNGGNYSSPTVLPTPPKADLHCPSMQYYYGSGSIFSPNYPISIPNNQSCEYVMGTKEETWACITFVAYNCSGTSLSLMDGLNSNQPFITFTTNAPTLNHPYCSTSNVLKMVFAVKSTVEPFGTGWEAEFNGI